MPQFRLAHAQQGRETPGMLQRQTSQGGTAIESAERIEQLHRHRQFGFGAPRANSAWISSWPHSTIASTLRPADWLCTAAIVRRISARSAGKGGEPPPTRIVRKNTALPSQTAVRSTSSESRSTSSRNSPLAPAMPPVNSDAAAQGATRAAASSSPPAGRPLRSAG